MALPDPSMSSPSPLAILSPAQLANLQAELFREPDPLPRDWQRDPGALLHWALCTMGLASLQFRAWQLGVAGAEDALMITAGTAVPSVELIVNAIDPLHVNEPGVMA